MTRRICIVILGLLWGASVYGQSYFGVFAGINNSRLSGDAPSKGQYEGYRGANLGLVLDLRLNQSVMLSLQPSFSQEGTAIFFKLPDQDEPVDSVRIRLNYFCLPLLLKVLAAQQRFYAVGGLEAAWLQDSFSYIDGEKDEIQSEVTGFNIAMHFGAGYRIPLGFPVLFFELRYSQGLVNLTDDPISRVYFPRVKTTGFKVFAGIEIPLSRPEN